MPLGEFLRIDMVFKNMKAAFGTGCSIGNWVYFLRQELVLLDFAWKIVKLIGVESQMQFNLRINYIRKAAESELTC